MTRTPCHYCHTLADQDPDCIALARENGCTPEEIAREDGTYNPATATYACNRCYIALGCPARPVPKPPWRAGEPLEGTLR